MKRYDVGVIVGRFQTPYLTASHQALIEYVAERHARVIVLLGVGAVPYTTRNPLDFEARREMFAEKYPWIVCVPIFDSKYDVEWVAQVDRMVAGLVGTMSAVLYGGRDSFIPHYNGRYECRELVSGSEVSATGVREEVARRSINSSDFRSGVITGIYRRFKNPIPTVDVIPFLFVNGTEYAVLLGRKPNEELWRLIGGFVDPSDVSLEAAAARELAEEANIFVGERKFHFEGSHKVDDWRYRSEPAGILTTVLSVNVTDDDLMGSRAADDISELKWWPANAVIDAELVPEHKQFLKYIHFLRGAQIESRK